MKNIYKDITWCSRECENEECKVNFTTDEEYLADTKFGVGEYDLYRADRCDDDCGFLAPVTDVVSNPDGSVTVVDIVCGQRVKRKYYEYSQVQAQRAFSKEFRNE